MTLNLLFDLDDTLLNTNLDIFLSGYFKKLTSHMAVRVPPEKFTEALMRSTQIMYGNKRTDQTLEQAFDKNFFSSLGFKKEEMAFDLEEFYDDIFPTLSALTAPRPEAINLVDWAFSKGWKVSIATDPLFPRKAILHRLRWAGLDPEKYQFTLVSDFHNFHFAKASVAYYPEFLARMNWLDEPVLMVGDSLERDVMPSIEAGVPVFWLTDSAAGKKNDRFPQGWYPDLKKYLESTDISQLKVNYGSPKALLAFLQATPAVMHTILLSISADQAGRRPAEDEWSFLEILCHLRDVDSEVNLARVETILREENAFISGLTTDQWADERQYFKQNLEQAFADFSHARAKLVALLNRLSEKDWDRRARHTFLGPITLRELVEIIVDHDRLHIKQAQDAVQLAEKDSSELPV